MKLEEEKKNTDRNNEHHSNGTGRQKRHLTAGMIVRRFIMVLITLVMLFLIAFFGAATVICYGPSSSARDLYVNTVMETSAAKFLAKIYFSDSEIDSMMAGNSVKIPEEVTDTSSVSINTASDRLDTVSSEGKEEDLYVENISEQTFRGKMLVVKDPSRVSIHTIVSFNSAGRGQTVESMINETDSSAGINAGGFDDPDGKGKGGMPLGPVIKNGVLVSDFESDYRTIIGFDAEHRLIVGDMSPEDAISRGMVDGICFGPALVINGERVPIGGGGGGLNPRTAIGQRSDGAMLLLVVDGRQPGSLGATYKDLTDVMLAHGAVNAANLDGGSSSVLYYQGELISSPASMVGIRPVPTAILVK